MKDFIWKKTKLLGFIPWEKKVVAWVKGNTKETPNPYIIPTKDISLIDGY